MSLEDIVKNWESKHAEDFKKEMKPEAEWVNESGIKIKRVYTPLDLEEKGFDYEKDVGMPGDYPFVRGLSATGYRGKLWSQSLISGYPTPEESNRFWKSTIETGIDTIFAVYDLPVQQGYDPDHPQARGEVGRVGVSMVSQRDWEIAFDGIDLTKVRLSQVANAVAAFQIANHLTLARKHGVDLNEVGGWCQNDILKEYICRGNFIFPPEPSLRMATDAVTYCAGVAPKYHAMSITSSHFSEFLGTPVHDAAFMLADIFCYVEAAIKRGIDVDVIAPSIELSVGTDHYSFFEDIAKYRAIRKVYARVFRDRFKAKKAESMMARVGCGHGGNALQRQQYLNNIARATICAVIGALGGAERINLRAYDEQYGIPTPEAMEASTRVMNVVSRETGIGDTVDPLAGSYFIESLTLEFEERINKELETVERLGGVIKCIENGYIKKTLLEDAYKWKKDFEAGKKIRVGANFANSEDEEMPPVRVYRADPKVERERIEAVQELRRKRDNNRVKKAIDEIKATAALPATPTNNLMPALMEAVEAYATIGEVHGCLREVWGEYREANIF